MIRRYNTALTLAWIPLAVLIAALRSLWGDEGVRYDQVAMGLRGAFYSLRKEPSPFNPGELLPYDFFHRLLSPLHVPVEVWGRMPGIFWGAATLYFCGLVAAKIPRARALPLLVFFSVAFVSLSVEMRPYGSLVFSGALALALLTVPDMPRKSLVLGLCAMTFFGHIYGICFVAYAGIVSLALRPAPRKAQWLLLTNALASFIIVFCIIATTPIAANQGGNNPLEFLSVARVILGTLANPYGAMLIYGPLFLLGLSLLGLRKNRNMLLVFSTLLIAVAGPVFVCWRANYYFVPRQVSGALVPFLFFVAAGVAWLEERKLRPLALIAILFASVIPWGRAVILNHPPFINQPFHRTANIAAQFTVLGAGKDLLMLDVCNAGQLIDYVQRRLGPPLHTSRMLKFGIRFERRCWESSKCIDTLAEDGYCAVPASYVLEQVPLRSTIESGNYSIIAHGFHGRDIEQRYGDKTLVLRDW